MPPFDEGEAEVVVDIVDPVVDDICSDAVLVDNFSSSFSAADDDVCFPVDGILFYSIFRDTNA